MGVENIHIRENEINEIVWNAFDKMKNVFVLAENFKERLPIFSFIIKDLHYNLGVKLLNDKFGIQVRGGCSCAGTYGHILLEVSQELSNRLTEKISLGDLSDKPGWIRMSFHPTMTNEEVEYCMNAVEQVSIHHLEWAKEYHYNTRTNEFSHSSHGNEEEKLVNEWFSQL